MNDLERQSIRDCYRALVSGSLLDRRDRLVIAGVTLAQTLAKDFFHTYPSANYSLDDLQGEASLALVEAAANAIDGRNIGNDVVAYLSGSIWKRLSALRDESPLIGPTDRTVRSYRKAGKKVRSVGNVGELPPTDPPSLRKDTELVDILDDVLEGCCEDLLDRTLVVYRSQGHSNEQIAGFTGFSQSTISRRLSDIKARYESSESLGA